MVGGPAPRTQGRSCSRIAAGEASAPNRCSLLMAREKNMINPFDASSHRHFAIWSQCHGWTSPCGSYDDCKMHLSNSHPGTLRKHGPLEDTWASSVLPSPLDPPKGPHLCLGTDRSLLAQQQNEDNNSIVVIFLTFSNLKS